MNPLGFIDQAFISAANFATTVLLARNLQPANFGAFALLFSLLMFVVAVQASLVTQPHNVFGATRAGTDYAQYTTLVAGIQMLFGIAGAALFLVVAVGTFVVNWTFAPLILAFAPLIVAWLAQEFVRRTFYTCGDVTSAIRNDLLCYGSQVSAVLLLAHAGALTAYTAVAALAGSSLLAFLAGLYQLRYHWTRITSWDDIYRTVVEHWRFGRWLLGSTVLSWTAGGWYVVLAMVGVVEAGAWRVLETIIGPVQVLTAALDSLVPPQAAKVHAAGDAAALRRFVFHVYALTAPPVVGYCLFITILAERIIEFVFGSQYQPYDWLLPLMALYTALAYCQQPVSLTLRAIGKTSAIFRAQMAAAIVGPPVGIIVGYHAGILGAAVGIITHFLVLNAVLWTTFLLLMFRGGREAPYTIASCRAKGHIPFGRRSSRLQRGWRS